MWLHEGLVYGRSIGEAVAGMWEEHLGCKVNITLGPYGGGLRPMIIEQKTDGWTYAFDVNVTPKVKSWEPMPKKRWLGGLEFAQPS